MRAKLIILLFVCSFARNLSAQLYLPNEQYYTNEADRIFLRDSAQKTYFNSHTSLRPILDKRTNTDSLYFKDSKHYIWLGAKIFKENFLIFEGEDFWCAVDPVIDFEGGTDLSAPDSLDFLYWNTRGIRVQGKFFEKVGFSTVFYENQAFLPNYLRNYVNAHGELRPVPGGYNQENAVIPGYARSKDFKTTGYDFAFAEGTVSIVPNEYFNVQFGNGNQFIGNGYRSLLLSDFSVNYPFAKFETNFWKNRIQYNAIYAIHQNLYRLAQFESVESTYERKIGTYHYLDFAFTPKLNIGLFEGALWRRSDSTGTHEPNWLFLNPVPFVNAGVMWNETANYNHILGLNFSWVFWKNRLYGQAIFDQGFNGFQLGISSKDIIVPKLDAQLEYNYTHPDTYFVDDKRYNYSNGNLPLAHPLASGFSEIVFKTSYEFKEIFFTNNFVYNKQQLNTSLGVAISILNDDLTTLSITGPPERSIINQFEAGYRFNKRNNLQAVLGWTFRNRSGPGPDTHTNYIYAAIRTRLRNKTLDY